MKKIFTTVVFLLVPFLLFAQSSKVYDDLSLTSKILNGERKYAIYLPPGYETSERSYPVLYLLHGSGDDQTGWVQFGEILHITDKAIKEGKATPMIIVMPDANTGRRGYVNSVAGDWQYEDFFFEELVPHVEKKYRIKGKKQFRAIAGLSMGGGGTFYYALHKPEMFSSACPLSASTGSLSLEKTREQLKRFSTDKDDFTDEQVEAFYKTYGVLNLIENLSEENKEAVRWYIDCGDDDFLYEGNCLVHIAMRKKEIPHEFRVREGGHNWTYWRDSLPEVLKFISETFHQH